MVRAGPWRPASLEGDRDVTCPPTASGTASISSAVGSLDRAAGWMPSGMPRTADAGRVGPCCFPLCYAEQPRHEMQNRPWLLTAGGLGLHGWQRRGSGKTEARAQGGRERRHAGGGLGQLIKTRERDTVNAGSSSGPQASPVPGPSVRFPLASAHPLKTVHPTSRGKRACRSPCS